MSQDAPQFNNLPLPRHHQANLFLIRLKELNFWRLESIQTQFRRLNKTDNGGVLVAVPARRRKLAGMKLNMVVQIEALKKQGFTFDEIAETTGYDVESVRTLLTRSSKAEKERAL